MTDFERDLRRVLQRREPPRDLTSAVMARIGREPKRIWSFNWRQAAAAASVVLLVATGADRYREYQRGQEARQELILALRITSQKLAVVQAQVDKLNRRSIGNDQ